MDSSSPGQLPAHRHNRQPAQRAPDDARQVPRGGVESSALAESATALQDVNPAEFVALVQPLLLKPDPQALLEFLKSRWTKDQMIALVRGKHADARKVAALCLTLVGTCCCVDEISKLLKDADPCVNQVAEHALWSIWFRAATDEANHHLHRGAQALGRKDVPHAISHFDRAIQLAPEFAEAYNQRAIAHFLIEEYEASLKDCRAAAKLMPQHFGAWAGMGHIFAHTGDLERAIDAYEHALSINPHMHAIREALNQLRDLPGANPR